jgi:starch phosphorylase
MDTPAIHPFLTPLPQGIEALVDLGLDLRWTWSHAADHLWKEIDPVVWARTGNPWLILQLYRLLEQEIVPLFYRRDAQGIPREWVARMRASMSRLAPQVSSNRMLQEYVHDAYLPASAAFRRRTAGGGRLAKELVDWASFVRRHWHKVHMSNLEIQVLPDGWSFLLHVYLGEIPPELVQVQMYAEPAEGDEAAPQVMECRSGIPGATHGYVYHCPIVTARPASDFTPRIIAWHPEARIPAEMNLILWFPG